MSGKPGKREGRSTGKRGAFRIRTLDRTQGAPGCLTPTKWGYNTRADAKVIAKEMRSTGPTVAKGQRLSVYRCPCGFFHVGHAPKGMSRSDLPSGRR